MTLVLVDTFFIKSYDLVNKDNTPNLLKKIIFSIIASGCILFELIIMNYTRSLIVRDQSVKKININFANKLTQVSQILLVVVFSYLIFELFYYNYYDSYLLMLIVSISYGVAIILIGKSLSMFVSWYVSNRNFIFLLYSISMSMIVFNLIMTGIIVNLGIQDRPEQIREFGGGGSVDISAGKYPLLSNMFKVSAILSFVSIWLTTALLMRDVKSRIVGNIQYWIMLTIPLAYFIISLFAQNILASLLMPIISSNPIFVSLIFTTIFVLSKPVGGVIFGLLFWRISKLISFERTLREYTLIAGYGFLLLFSANQSSSLVLTPFPPLGASTVTVLILATYLIFVGIYKSAVLASTNLELRNAIYRLAKDSKVLNLFGKAENEKEIKNTVTKIINYSQNTSPEITVHDLDEFELKKYVEKVISELRKK